uniref:General transcription factor 3C polypeptide 1 n=1 Tax=Magallana gigas TaxID=29159 RepID=K1QQ60_MAGGI
MDLDYKAILTEEIALEGLDGITLQALWVRLENRPNFKMRLDEGSQEFLWRCILSIPDLEFYRLPSPRGVLNPKLPIVIDPESGVTVDFDMGEELYPIKIIQQEGPIIGSCSTYDSRQCVTMEIKADNCGNWPAAKDVTEKYGMSLVMVASQEQRFTALCGDELEPNSLYSLTPVNFCILERIGRSRRVGELSIGDSSLQVFNIQPKSMFYHTLCLIKLGLVKKQSITVYNKKGQNSLRRLFHLTRFYQQYQSKYTILTNIVATYLNKQPMKRQEIHKTREQCGIDQKSLKKLYQTSKRFKVYSLSYKQVHPDSPESQWYTKKCELKMVRVIEVLEEEESDVEDDEDIKMDDTAKDDTVFPQLVEPSFLRQAYAVLEAAGTDGVSNSKMMKRLTIDGLEVRMIIRTMERRGLITSLMTEKVVVKQDVIKQEVIPVIRIKYHTGIAEASKASNDVKSESDKTESKAKSAGKKKGGSPKKKEKVKAIEEEVSGIVNNVGRHKRHFKTDVSATCQQMKRINMILDIIKENKIVDGVYPIVKLIREKEREENAYMVDKKTVMRLIAILVKEKKINIINTTLLDGSKQKNLQMLLSKEVEPTDQIVKSLIDQAHMKFQAVNKEQLAKKNARTRGIPENSNIPETAREGILQIMSHRSKLKAEDMIYDVAYSKQYDFRPKYSRAKILHSLLWYLVYDFPESSWPLTDPEGGVGTPPCPPVSSGDKEIEEDVFVLIDKIPKPSVYKDEMSWKRFLSPLPRHKGYDEGWFLASDILLKLPLVIFCNVIYIPYRVRGLRELLDDPEKRFYPIVSLPTPITQQLLYARKYIFSFFNDCVVLCNMGLLSIGPQIMKEKDKVFFYLHKKASLLDTKNSRPDKRDEEEAVTVNSAVVPLPDARSSVKVEEVKDDGFVPGDKRGAAVQVKIEGTRFAKKNNFATLQKVRSGLAGVLPRPKERVSLHTKEKSPEIIRVSLTTNVKGNKGGKGVKRKPASTDANSSVPAKKAKTILKKVKQKKVKPKLRKFIYDEIDIEAYKKKKGQRVSWSPYEDSLLLTSKIATLVMDKKRRGVLIPWSYIRDVLYHYAPQESVDKTSSACQRRVTHSLKNPSTKQNLLIYLSEAMQDPYVKEFSQKQYLQASEHACKEFRTLVDYLVTKFSNVELQKTFMPASLAQVKDYDITSMTHFNLRKITPPKEPRSRADILEYVAKDIIHSFVSSAYDKQGRSHQMFKLLSQYPDSILDKAIDKLKYDGVIVQNKKKEKLRPVDSGTNNLKLSQKYHYRFHSRYPTSIYNNTLTAIKEIVNTYPYEDNSSPESIEIKEVKNGGICAALVQLLYGRQVSIYVGIPPDIVILDPQYRQGFNQHMSLGKRSRLHEKENRPKVLEQNTAWESTKTFDGPSPYVYDEDGSTIVQFNTSDRSSIQFHFDSSMDENKKGKEKSKLSTVCASRALVTMRRSRAEQDADLKHYNVQDHFLIQACDIRMRLCKDDDLNEVDPDLVLRDIPYDRSKARTIIKNAQRFVPFQLDLEEVWSSVEPASLDNMKSVYRLIHDAGEMGICYFNLKELVNDWEVFRVSIGHLLNSAAVDKSDGDLVAI